MNTSQVLRSLLLASTLAGIPTHAADPQPSAAPAAADIQALVALLNKIAAQAAAEPAAADDEAPTPAAPAPAPAAKAFAPGAKPPLSTALKTGSLTTSSLTPSTGLDGRGAGTFIRMTEEAWRMLFPVKQAGN
jgi:hypothetical protein